MPHGYSGQNRTRAQKASNSKFSQASMRRHVIAYDQHDREWSMSVENSNGMPVGLISPMFSAPWRPDQNYLRINPDNVTELWIDYPQMWRDRSAALAKYHQEAVDKASANKWPVPVKGDYDERIISTIGKPPSPLQPVEAAYQGNGWILGFRARPTTAADRLLAERWVLDTRVRAQTEAAMASGFDFRDRSEGGAGAAQVTRDFAAVREASIPLSAEAEAFADDEEATDGEGLDAETAATLDAAGTDAGDEELERYLDLEEQADPKATGGQRVLPEKADRPSATPRRPKPQRAARPAAEAPTRPRGARVRAFEKKGRKSLADGARPVIAD